MTQEDSHPCQVFIGGKYMHWVLLTAKVLDSGKFQVNGCSAWFVINRQRQTKDAIALDCTIVPAQK